MNVRVKWLILVLLPLATSSVLAEGDFIKGAKVWAEVCGGCHTYRDQTDFNDNQWVTTMSHMRIRAGLTGQEMRDVVAFLQTANGPAAKATIPDEDATPPTENATTPTGNAIVNLTGYGTEGPDRDRSGFDYAAFWARSGIMSSLAETGGPPTQQRPGMGDQTTSLPSPSTA